MPGEDRACVCNVLFLTKENVRGAVDERVRFRLGLPFSWRVHMDIQRWLRVIAGFFVLVSLAEPLAIGIHKLVPNDGYSATVERARSHWR
jgi:hypothetical protein